MFDVMMEDGFKCAFTSTSKGLHVCEMYKIAWVNVFGSEGFEKNVNSVDGTYYATLGIDVDESGEADVITGV